MVVLEGVDGVGKTTRWKMSCALLSWVGARVVCTREPATVVGKFASRFLVGRGSVFKILAFLLFMLDRLLHAYFVGLGAFRGYKEALSRGYVVLSDRWWVSSLAYQFCGERLWLMRLANFFAPVPDVVFYVDRDVDSEHGWARQCYKKALDALHRKYGVRVVRLGSNAYKDSLLIIETVQQLAGEWDGNDRALRDQGADQRIYA